jgi:predicted Zn finger-like uncharacterized protein
LFVRRNPPVDNDPADRHSTLCRFPAARTVTGALQMNFFCPKCSTRFAIAADRIAETGSKVRCARCKHVFTVHRPVEQAAVPPPRVDHDAFTHDPPGNGHIDAADLQTTDFDYDKFQELDAGNGRNPGFTSGSDSQHGDGEAPAAGWEERAAAPPGNSSGDAEGAAAAEAEGSVPRPGQKSGVFAILIKTLLLLILAILIIGGVLVYINGPEQLNRVIREQLGQPVADPSLTGQISLGLLEGKFLVNDQVGELFLIRGEAINNFSQPRSAIQVKGVLYDQHGKPLMQKTVFCGNPIDDEDLRSLSFEELEQMMGNQFGKNLSNMKIDPKKSIPFDIIFKDLPANIAEFSVKVTSSRTTTD